MKTLVTIAAASALAFAYQVSASPLNMDVYTVDNAAHITVTENGQPAAGVPVSVEGIAAQTVKTAADGSVVVRNFNDNAATYTFSVQQKDGSTLTTKRFLSRQQ